MPDAVQELNITKSILSQPTLTDGAKLLYLALLAAMVPTDFDRLAGMIGRDSQSQSVKNALASLIEQNFVTVKEEQNQLICYIAFRSIPRDTSFTDFFPSRSRSTRSRRRLVGGKR